jgi:glycosyltransferase involved in cell wall biosynthesis
MPLSKPLVSIVIPTYEMKGQGVFFLERCLQSIYKQRNIDAQQLEIVISDQSRDQAIEQYCQNASSALHYHRTHTGVGVAAHNLNMGIHISQGQYVKILFQDDLLVEDHYLSTIFKVITEKTPECILTKAVHTKDGENYYSPITPNNNPFFLFGNNTVSSPSVLTVARSTLKKIPFDEHLKLLFDCDFYYRLFQICQSIEVIEDISIANGIWDGQTQFAISPEQFTKEVRYLNWKYPKAQLTQLLPSYEQYFKSLYPKAPFPFDTNIQMGKLQRLWLDLIRT